MLTELVYTQLWIILPLAQPFGILEAEKDGVLCPTGHCALPSIASSHPSSIRHSAPTRKAVSRMPPPQVTFHRNLPRNDTRVGIGAVQVPADIY